MSGGSGSCLDLWALYPELLLAGLGLLLVPVAGFARGRWQRLPGLLTALGLIGAIILTARMLSWEATTIFCETYAIDGFATVFKLMIELGSLITLLMLLAHFHDHSQMAHAPIALIFSTLGCIGLTSSLDLGLIVLFLQMLSLASYLLVSLVRHDKRANEATLKYFIYAAAALAIMAYGLTFLYGLVGSLELRAIGQGLQSADRLWIAVAAGLVLIGYGFEMTLVPFHFWAPDVYQGSTAPIAGFLSVVPKIAGFAGFLRFALLALPGGLVNWPLLVAFLAGVTMTLGNLVALRQTRLKRLLAYSSIAQAGYVLLAVAVADRVDGALSAAGYYLAAYLFMNLGAFAVVAQLERAAGSDRISALQGLGRQTPFPAAVLAFALLSLAGIPPLGGFVAKIFLLKVALAGGLTWLAVIAVINMVLGLYYYMAVIAEMYLRNPADQTPPALSRRVGYTMTLGLTTLGTFILGILPGPPLALTHLIARLVQ